METIYVQLLGEGIDVWRPVRPTQLAPRVYELETPEDFDADLETWEFPPSSVVEVETRELYEGPTVVAARLALDPRRVGPVEP